MPIKEGFTSAPNFKSPSEYILHFPSVRFHMTQRIRSSTALNRKPSKLRIEVSLQPVKFMVQKHKKFMGSPTETVVENKWRVSIGDLLDPQDPLEVHLIKHRLSRISACKAISQAQTRLVLDQHSWPESSKQILFCRIWMQDSNLERSAGSS